MKQVYDFLAGKADRVQEALKTVTMDLDFHMKKVEELRVEQEKFQELLREFDEFFDKREAIEDVITAGNSGVLVEPPTKDVRQPGAEPGVPL